MFGLMEDEMHSRLREIVSGKTVWALGSGHDTQEAWQLLSFGASLVYAIDKHHRSGMVEPSFRRLHTGATGLGDIVECRAYFTEFEEFVERKDLRGPDIAFIKWPPVSPTVRLTQLISRAASVVYIGRNDGVTACGNSSLWRCLRGRLVREEITGKHNDMIVYGASCDLASKPRCREELNVEDRW